ncbi:hypothetical protein PTR02_14895 [Serratia nevei]|uniref:hypothetical protein n=1 Tax=Serratia TaxID=613 RepID=UPI001CDC45BD|nr:hypothetical protein [Serratia marcescens]MCA4111110.1 hypothetical protein [Serratia marcescens]
MVWQPGEFGRKVRFCRLFATIVAFFSRSGKTQRIKIPFSALNMHQVPDFSTIFPLKNNGDIMAGALFRSNRVGIMAGLRGGGFSGIMCAARGPAGGAR